MFDNPHYITRGVENELTLKLINDLWQFIDKMEVAEKDYLQIFYLSEDGGNQKVVHKQEQPEYCREHILQSDNPITTKVYVIDDVDHSTMLLAEEY